MVCHKKNGTFIISLDFELFWGMHDVISIKAYENNLLGTQQAVKEILTSFKMYDIHATWAIVGMLYFQNWNELKESFPNTLPFYHQEKRSPYFYMNENNISKMSKSYFFAPHLIKEITKNNHQEIATHTFSHFYTLEKGATESAFTADLKAALKIAKKHENEIQTIIFPRNQINETFLQICFDHGITSYRGRENAFIYSFKKNDRRMYHIRLLRLIDQYLNLFGHQTYPLHTTKLPVNLASSRFLMPYNKGRKLLEPLKLRRIKNSMTYAAKHKEIYHLWWHPHNFGLHVSENMNFLHKVLKHYKYLHKNYGFQSQNMKEITEQIKRNKHSEK